MSKKTLIIKAKSRLGMKYIPHGGSELNIGVEDGPDVVLTENFLRQINEYEIIDYSFSLPEAVPDDKYYFTLAKEINELALNIEKSFLEGNIEFILTVGGDHSIASASLLSTIRLMKNKKVGVIMFDSHGDVHLKKTSPSGNYHGMWLRSFWGKYDDTEIEKIIDVSLDGSQLLYIGNVLLEDEEIKFIENNHVKLLSSEKFNDNAKSNSYTELNDFCNRHDVLHISFDIDVFNTEFVKATGTPNPNGFNKEMIFEIINALKKSQKIISLDIVEVNPKKPGADETVSIAQEVIMQFIK